jgi:hypothetical protein
MNFIQGLYFSILVNNWILPPTGKGMQLTEWEQNFDCILTFTSDERSFY